MRFAHRPASSAAAIIASSNKLSDIRMGVSASYKRGAEVYTGLCMMSQGSAVEVRLLGHEHISRFINQSVTMFFNKRDYIEIIASGASIGEHSRTEAVKQSTPRQRRQGQSRFASSQS